MTIVCPVCNKDDAIQKASAIFSAGVASGSNYSFSQTELSRRLAPPAKPTYPSNSFLILIIIGLILGGMFVGGICSSSGDIITPCIIISISWGIAGWLIYSNNSQHKKRLSEFEVTYKHWETAMRKWDELYYCARDDCVFNTSTRKYASPNNINELLL